MEFFNKWPNWLRWVLFLPLSILGMFIFTFIGRISVSFMGYEPDAPISKTAIQFISTGGFFYVMYECLPKLKEIITGIFSLIWALIAVIAMYYLFINGNWLNWDFFIDLLLLIGCIVTSILMFIEYGKNNIKDQ